VTGRKAAKAATAQCSDGLRGLVGLGKLTASKAKANVALAQALHGTRRRRAQPEAAIQRAVIDHLRWRAPRDCFCFHVGNGGFRRPNEAAILQALGVVAGVPDLLIIYRGQLFALELKVANGRLSPAQAECHKRLRQAGAIVGVAVGIDAALDWLEAHGLLRRAAA
jgi:hypothetical protein